MEIKDQEIDYLKGLIEQMKVEKADVTTVRDGFENKYTEINGKYSELSGEQDRL